MRAPRPEGGAPGPSGFRERPFRARARPRGGSLDDRKSKIIQDDTIIPRGLLHGQGRNVEVLPDTSRALPLFVSRFCGSRVSARARRVDAGGGSFAR